MSRSTNNNPGNTHQHNRRVCHARRAIRAAERTQCLGWRKGEEAEFKSSSTTAYRPICRRDKSGHQKFIARPPRPNRRYQGGWDEILDERDLYLDREPLDEFGMALEEVEIWQIDHSFDEDEFEWVDFVDDHDEDFSERLARLNFEDRFSEDDEFCSCSDCRDERATERREAREREIDLSPIDDLDAEDFGLLTREPRRSGYHFTTFHQPDEKSWKGPQWARHSRRVDRRVA